MIADSTAPLNDATEAGPGTSWDEIHACLEAVRHAVKSCARCTGSPYALVSAQTNRNYARDMQYCPDRILDNCHHPVRFLRSIICPLNSLTSRRTNKITPARRRCHQYALLCSRSFQLMQPVTPNPLQPKGHLRKSTQGRSYDPGRVATVQHCTSQTKKTQFPDVVNRQGDAHSLPFRGSNAFLMRSREGKHAALHELVLVICTPLGVR